MNPLMNPLEIYAQWQSFIWHQATTSLRLNMALSKAMFDFLAPVVVEAQERGENVVDHAVEQSKDFAEDVKESAHAIHHGIKSNTEELHNLATTAALNPQAVPEAQKHASHIIAENTQKMAKAASAPVQNFVADNARQLRKQSLPRKK